MTFVVQEFDALFSVEECVFCPRIFSCGRGRNGKLSPNATRLCVDGVTMDRIGKLVLPYDLPATTFDDDDEPLLQLRDMAVFEGMFDMPIWLSQQIYETRAAALNNAEYVLKAEAHETQRGDDVYVLYTVTGVVVACTKPIHQGESVCITRGWQYWCDAVAQKRAEDARAAERARVAGEAKLRARATRAAAAVRVMR